MATWRAIRALLRDESGPTSVEYATLLAYIAIAALIVVVALATTINDMFASLNEFLASLIPDAGIL